jgi:hypothetical protein
MVFVIVAMGISVWVLPVMGTRNAKKGSVGAALDVGVKNSNAKACWVIAISGGLGVAVYLGRRISEWISGVPPKTRNGSRSAKYKAPTSAKTITTPSVFLFTNHTHRVQFVETVPWRTFHR